MDVETKNGGTARSARDAFVERSKSPDKSVKLQRNNEKAGGMRSNAITAPRPA